MIGIDLSISGDPASIRALSTWIDEQLRKSVSQLKEALKRVDQETWDAWRGESGDGFREAVGKVRDRISGIDDYSGRAAIAFRAYAFRVENGKERFVDLAASARTAGLSAIDGIIIYSPTNLAPTECTVDPPSSNNSSRDAAILAQYRERVQRYAQISQTVEAWRNDQIRWYREHIVPLLNEITGLIGIDQLLDGLKAANGIIVSGIIEAETLRNNAALAGLQKTYADFQSDIDGVRVGRRSGNPAVSGPASDFDMLRAQNRLDEIGLATSKTIRVGNFLKLGGATVSLVTTSIEVASGEDLGIVGAGLLGGYAGGAVGAGLSLGVVTVTGVTIPVWLSVGTVVVAGTAGTTIGKSLYDNLVPLDTREELAVKVPHAVVNSSTVPGSWTPRLVF